MLGVTMGSPQQVTMQQLQWLESALAVLHSPEPCEQRRTAEAALLQFQRTDAAWTLCLYLLQHPHSNAASSPAHLPMFAAQTLRAKINEQGSKLPPGHLLQLRQALLDKLGDPALPTALLRQLCLAVASLTALLPSSEQDALLQPVSTLPWRNAVQLLHDLAEEGSSDWRHVTVPGLTSSEKLSWATTTRDRFRSWAPQALQLLHAWIQQQQQQQQAAAPLQQQRVAATVSLLECLTAWVKLGGLHHVSAQVAEATAQAGLLHIQDADDEVVSAALGLLNETQEFAPEQLVGALEPHMLQVAAAAVRAATSSPPDLMHAAAWASAFSAWAAAVPQRLLASGEEEGGGAAEDVRQALLQVAGLPHIYQGRLVCLPALHCWSAVLSHDSPASAARFAAAGGGSGGLSRASTAADAAEEAAAAEVAAALEAVAGDTPPGVQHEVLEQACRQLLLQTACNCMGWMESPEGREAAGTCEASAAVHDVLLAACCLLGEEPYLQCILSVWDPHHHHHQQQQQQQQGEALQQVLRCVATAPAELRLQGAVVMAAAAAVPAGHVGQAAAAAAAEGDLKLQQACSSIAGLLSQAAVHVRQGQVLAGPLHSQHTLNFCKAVQVWAPFLTLHFASGSNSQGAAAMGSLLELLLAAVAQQQEGPSPTRSAAAAAVRALTSAALALGWDQLYLATPLLLQAAQHLSGVDAADQDMFASLSMCLAAVGAPDRELQELRARSSQQLVQPVVQHMDGLLQQLQAGQQWSAMGKAADVQLCQHMMGVRVVLEAARQRQEHMHRRVAASSSGGGSGDAPASAAAAASGVDDDSSGMLEDAPWAQQLGRTADDCSLEAELSSNPAVQLVVTRLWGQLHALVVQHAGAGRFLQHYAKCCSKLLKLRPELLLRPPQQLLQFAEVCVLGLVRPGGCALSEPLLAAVELCCQQQGSDLLLESAPVINQAYVQLWALPQVLALQQRGQGDAQPDLTEALLKLSAAWVRHSTILQPSNTQLAAALPHIITAAAACARCCHKKVGSAALATLLALLGTAAAAGSGAGCWQQFQDIVAGHAVLILTAGLDALLVPSPLPRLQKVSSVLLEVAALASLVELAGTGSMGGLPQQQSGAGGVVALGAAPQSLLHSWLLQATQAFVPAALSAQEAADLAAACSGLLTSSTPALPAARAGDGGGGGGGSSQARQAPASRSYVAARRLKKRLRDFAERFMRTQPT